MQNTLQDLNNYLFEAIERVNDDDLTEEQLEKETKKDYKQCKNSAGCLERGKCTGSEHRQESSICANYREKGKNKR